MTFKRDDLVTVYGVSNAKVIHHEKGYVFVEYERNPPEYGLIQEGKVKDRAPEYAVGDTVAYQPTSEAPIIFYVYLGDKKWTRVRLFNSPESNFFSSGHPGPINTKDYRLLRKSEI